MNISIQDSSGFSVGASATHLPLSTIVERPKPALQQSIQNLYFENALLHTITHDPETFYSAISSQYREGSTQETQGKIRDYIKLFLKKKVVDAYLPAQRAFLRITQHGYNLFVCRFEKQQMKQFDILAIATYIETAFRNNSSTQPTLLPSTRTLLPRNLFYNRETSNISVLANEKLSTLQSNGSFKQVTSAINLSLVNPNRPYRKTVHAQSLDSCGKEGIDATWQELMNFTSLGSKPGIVPFGGACRAYNEKGQLVIHAIFDGFDADISKIHHATTEQKLQVVKGAWKGLYSLHMAGFVHGDIKAENTLYKALPDGSFEAVLADLSLSFSLTLKQQPPLKFQAGYYGFIGATAPELFGREYATFSQRQYMNMDIFAFGCMLYKFFSPKNELPAWSHLIGKSYIQDFWVNGTHANQQLLSESRQQMSDLIDTIVEEPLKVLLSKKTLTQEEQIDRMIFEMLRKAPTQRRLVLPNP